MPSLNVGDIIYDMNTIVTNMYNNLQDRLSVYCRSYGKVTLATGACVVSMICLYLIATLSQTGVLRVSFLDIGQGDAILITTPSGHDMLIDGGASDRILERLADRLSYTDRTLDVVVNTHPDTDHSTGLIPVYAMYKVGRSVISPVDGSTEIFKKLETSILEEGGKLHTGKRGNEIDFGDGVVARILYPSSPYYGSPEKTNDASVSMLITYGETSVLLTGDLPSTHEDELLSAQLPHHVTIFKAGHHGSKYSSGDQLLSYIRPEYAVISAGKDNRYNHPNTEAVDRLTKYSKEVLSTIDRGTITFESDGSNVRLSTSK